MMQRFSDNRTVWMMIGLLAGLGIATLWPHEQARATAVDRDAQFAMTTCQVAPIDPVEAVFVLDFLTGSLKGAVLNRTTGLFASFYFRDLPQDFQIDPKKEAHYCIITGNAQMAINNAANPPATSVVYVGELTTGRIIAYGFSQAGGGGPRQMFKFSEFQFREPEPAE